jgi:decaprenylphospho-beta-D-ribofuranose 2-oxidase
VAGVPPGTDRSLDPGLRLTAPPVPVSVIARPSARALNEVWFRRAPAHRAGEVQGIGAFFHPLDGVRRWNRLYGPRGFVQYQFVVPDGREDVVEAAISSLRAAGCAAFLAVLKRFGAADPAPLSFPRPGWTLALDLPATRPDRLAPQLDRLDALVADAGGAVYLAKDARCRPDLLARMYPRLAQWQAVRERMDPERRFRSDLASRMGL